LKNACIKIRKAEIASTNTDQNIYLVYFLVIFNKSPSINFIF